MVMSLFGRYLRDFLGTVVFGAYDVFSAVAMLIFFLQTGGYHELVEVQYFCGPRDHQVQYFGGLPGHRVQSYCGLPGNQVQYFCGLPGHQGALSDVVMLIFFLQTVVVEHLVCSQLSSC